MEQHSGNQYSANQSWRRRLGPIVALLVVAAAGAACGRADPSSGAQARIDTMTSQPSTGFPAMPSVRLPAGTVPVSGRQVDAALLPADEPRLVWTTGDRRVLGLFGNEGSCLATSAQLTTQNRTQVIVTLVEQQPLGKPCPNDLRYQPLTVTLAQPLGDRTVRLLRVAQTG